jgi:hypothetical protein
MRYRRQVGPFHVVAECAGDLRPQAEGLLEVLAKLHARGPALHDGTAVQFGWSLLRLLADDKELVVCEPDFAGDPFHNFVPTVETTLRVTVQQVALLKFIGANEAGPDSRFQDRLIAARGWLRTDHIYLERSSPDPAKHESGWYVGQVEGGKGEMTADDLEALYVYQLLRLRPALMKVLALPAGYLVVFRGGAIEAVVDPGGKDVWPA